MKVCHYLLVLFCVSISCCEPVISNHADYLQYLADPDHGLVHTQEREGLRLSFKYLPTDYLVSSELRYSEDSGPVLVDSLRSLYASSCTFLLTIGPASAQVFDVTKIGVYTYEQYVERIMQLTYGLQELIYLEQAGEKIEPALVQFEEQFSLQDERRVTVVFPISIVQLNEQATENIPIHFDDQIFGTGHWSFSFALVAIQDTPVLSLN